MIVYILKDEKVVSYKRVDPTYQPKANEVMVDAFPKIELGNDEIARLYYRNGKIEAVKENELCK